MMKSVPSIVALLLLPAAVTAQAGLDFDNIRDEITDEFAQTECGKAVLAFADTFGDAQQGSCTTAFNDVNDLLELVPLPDVGIGGIDFDIDFSLPENITALIPDLADVVTQCETGGCIEALTEKLDDIDAKCSEGVFLGAVLTAETYANIRKVRAIVSVYCLSDAAGNLCFPDAFGSLPSTANGLFSGISFELPELPDGLPLFPSSREADSNRESLCSVCSQVVQQGLFAAYDFDANANNFHMLSQLSCLRDTDTNEFCQPKELMLNGLGFVRLENIWKLIFNEEDLCMSSCATQAIGLLSPRLTDSEVFPDGCYEPLSEPFFSMFSLDGLGNFPNISLDSLLGGDGFSLANLTNISVPQLVRTMEEDIEAGLGLPPGSLQVNLTDVVDGLPVFGASVLKTIPGDEDEIVIPGLDFQKTNRDFSVLASPATRSFQGAVAAGTPTSSPSSSPTTSSPTGSGGDTEATPAPTNDGGASGSPSLSSLVSVASILAVSSVLVIC